MKKAGYPKRSGRIALLTATSLLMLGSGSVGIAADGHHGGGGFHGGGFHGGGFHGGGFHGGGFHGGGFHAGRFRGIYGGPHGFHGGYHGFRPYGPGWARGWGWGPGWGLGLGLYLPVLPWYYTTFWWDGVPYYYAQDDYYVWDPDENEYEQIQPPPQVEQEAQGGGQPPQAPQQLYAYPKKGQTVQQQATDKRECSSWASAQTGLNPAAGTAGTSASAPRDATANQTKSDQSHTVGAPASAQDWQNYLRAESACLEARGYTVE